MAVERPAHDDCQDEKVKATPSDRPHSGGDFILDNKVDEVRLWTRTPYHSSPAVVSQSAVWMDLDPAHDETPLSIAVSPTH